jgi:hypothetical protein
MTILLWNSLKFLEMRPYICVLLLRHFWVSRNGFVNDFEVCTAKPRKKQEFNLIAIQYNISDD